jgi:hypothetical protein
MNLLRRSREVLRHARRNWPIFNGVCWLEPDARYWGHFSTYYDGIHHAWGFIYFAVGWQTAEWVAKKEKKGK